MDFELGLADLAAYRAYLETDPAEWAGLDALTHITISRFRRDRGVFEVIDRQVLPQLARRSSLSAWSAGCASGEEPYTLAIGWARRTPLRTRGVRAAKARRDLASMLVSTWT